MSAFLDPRVRMREALRELIAQNPATWAEPSLFVMRNRLLDITGSDARPLAEFLLEAWQRGWGDRLSRGGMEAAQFDALVSPFVLQWSAERFVQPEMARWAVESTRSVNITVYVASTAPDMGQQGRGTVLAPMVAHARS